MNLQSFLVWHLKRMLRCFTLEHFDVHIKRAKGIGATMDVLVDYEYLDVVIRYGVRLEKLWKRGRKEEVLKDLTHEVTHILTGIITDEMKQTRRMIKAEEQATELISRLLYRLYRRKK